MQHYTDILFDLDGTLTDSSGGITDCFRRAMEAFGYDCPSAEILKGQIIGPPIEDISITRGSSHLKSDETLLWHYGHGHINKKHMKEWQQTNLLDSFGDIAIRS